jgi:CheY-like chemotaxis protein
MTKILYIEDNEDNIFMLKSRLERKGFHVEVAKDGEEGIALARHSKPDLIIMDISLPKKDGYAATQFLKQEGETKSIPIIVLTAHALPKDKELALEAGADEYESKPVDFQRLLKKIAQFLS